MDREVLYAYTVYQFGSFSKAAQKLYVTQPALSTSIKKLEDRLGTAIFDRKTTPVSLTAEGEFYIQSVKKIIDIENEVEAFFTERAYKQKRIVFGSSSFFCAHILPKLIIQFQERYPNYEIELTEAGATTLRDKLERGLIDLTLTAEMFESERVEGIPWVDERLVLAVPSDYPINSKLKKCALSYEDIKSKRYQDERFDPVSLSAFKDEPFLLLKQNNESYFRVLKMCEKKGFFPRIKMQLDQLLTAYYVAQDGTGITFLRDDLLSYVAPTDKLLFYKIDDALTTRPLYLHYRKNEHGWANLQPFLDFMLQVEQT